MGNIRLLDMQTANQIAAGEVVERPVAVLKELVENAIDAGSRQIRILVEKAGQKKIEVVDDGIGMSREDLFLAVQRHATSKIGTITDLDHLATLGFRGEALASIAAVSHFSISSKQKGKSEGFRLSWQEEGQAVITEIAMNEGTAVQVQDLFYNTPARKKFLKSDLVELSKMTAMVTQLALSHPNISFSFYQGKKRLFFSPGRGDLQEVLLEIYGRDVVKNLKFFSNPEKTVYGYVSMPDMTRANRNYCSFFVNGRVVKSKELTRLTDEVFFTLLPEKRFPYLLLFLELPASKIDVNVHPAKLEIKFHDFSKIEAAVTAILKALFRDNRQDLFPCIEEKKSYQKEIMPAEIKSTSPAASCFPPHTYPEKIQEQQSYMIHSSFIEEKAAGSTNKLEKEEKNFLFSDLTIVGVFQQSYILTSWEDELYFIDQHAAYERVNYEKIRQALSSAQEEASIQNLAIPLDLEVTAEQNAWLIENIVLLNRMGFILEEFGEGCYILRGVPSWLENDPEFFLQDLIDRSMTKKKFHSMDEEKLMQMACKYSVKAKKYLTDADIVYLLEALDKSSDPYTCPHGRPVMIKMTRQELERRFLRV